MKTSPNYPCLFGVEEVQDPITPSEWLTVQQAAQFPGKRLNIVASWCKTGEITTIPVEYANKINYRIPTSGYYYEGNLKSKESISILYKNNKNKDCLCSQ